MGFLYLQLCIVKLLLQKNLSRRKALFAKLKEYIGHRQSTSIYAQPIDQETSIAYSALCNT